MCSSSSGSGKGLHRSSNRSKPCKSFLIDDILQLGIKKESSAGTAAIATANGREISAYFCRPPPGPASPTFGYLPIATQSIISPHTSYGTILYRVGPSTEYLLQIYTYVWRVICDRINTYCGIPVSCPSCLLTPRCQSVVSENVL